MKLNFVRLAFLPMAAVLLCTLGVTPSKAQTTLQLSLGTTGDDLNVVGTGGQTINVNDRVCSGGTCIFGTGSANTTNPTTSGTYMLTSPTATAFSLTPGTVSGSYNVNQTSPITLSYTSTGGTLTGNLTFLNATDSAVNSQGVSMVTLVGTLTITGGSLASSAKSPTSMTVNLALYNSLSSLIGGTSTLTAQVENGSITPEPGSIFLFGSGLLALGFLLRLRRHGISGAQEA